MSHGPGKYDDACTAVRVATQAQSMVGWQRAHAKPRVDAPNQVTRARPTIRPSRRV